MAEGVTVLWLLSLFFSGAVWVYGGVVRAREGRFLNRRQMSGCELARRLLDRHHQTRTAIVPVRREGTGHPGSHANRLYLTEKAYYGKRLFEITEALHDASRSSGPSHTLVPRTLRAPGGRFFQGFTTLGWFLLVLGFLLQGAGGLLRTGQGFLIGAAFLALAALPEEWEVTERALSNLAPSEDLGPDEKIRMKKLFRALRWRPLAGLLEAPWNFFTEGSTLELSKSERVH